MSRRAFTLIELLVVISIVAFLSSVVLSSLNSARDKGRLASGKQFDMNIYHAAADQAVGVWDFDECLGSTAADRSGLGNNGALTNILPSAWSSNTPDGKGCSLSLTGSDTVISVTPAPMINKAGALTISAWVKFAPGVVSAHTITIRGNTYYVVPFAHFYYEAGLNKLVLWNGNGNTAALSAVISIEDNNWHHVAVSALSGGKVSFYLDGKDVTPDSGNNTYSDPGGTFMDYPFEIGGRTHTTGIIQELTGSIDTVRIYLKALTAGDIERLYASESERRHISFFSI